MRINRKQFFDYYRKTFGRLSQDQVEGLEAIISFMEADTEMEDIRQAAYMLATIKHECADTWEPIEEYGKGRGRAYGSVVSVKGDDGETHKCIYYGRGYVQLTWAENYFKMGRALGIPLHVYPELALKPEIAYRIMSYGMRHGMFTGRKITDFIHGNFCSFYMARKVINGLDCAEKIAGYARAFDIMLWEASDAE